jgi:hypothetical protein
MLLFDVAEPGRAPGGASKTNAEGEDWAVMATAEEDREQRLLTRRITSFRRIGALYRRDYEVHRLRLLPREDVAAWLNEIGFEVTILAAYGELKLWTGLAGFVAAKPRDHGCGST